MMHTQVFRRNKGVQRLSVGRYPGRGSLAIGIPGFPMEL